MAAASRLGGSEAEGVWASVCVWGGGGGNGRARARHLQGQRARGDELAPPRVPAHLTERPARAPSNRGFSPPDVTALAASHWTR